ncbi:MAG TPA: DegT/DnrJ/EryC1/StrS family aminotransferase [Anaerohalosphaeraceae bacterium]|jgi:perosamine synthetase|nr:DegT/DnrJ/EryC1/StrS family aminotransferase [Anaerohalosphaeraceae bacterium]HRT49169.1 DegT/DnrJ/EryC1/StrS family aminotransferase [Anaerohalosphaeraceae bacterium]HRT85292.1 DegT/DnrJ/EryC1/StrS family aminotransferase [Anaerohalosphaeraceae bacterium]
MDFKVHLSRPDITDAEIEAVCAVLRSPTLSLGPKLDEFEQAFCAYTGRRRAVAVNSGTSALYLCMKALGIGRGDEVITTPFTFIATATTIMMTGARPVFVDIDPRSLNMDASRIGGAVTPRTKAVVPVEVFGNPAGMDAICEVAAKHNLLVIEDSCEGLGSELRGRKVGTFGIMSTFAFYPNKQITTGEGGMILTDDDALADMCVSLRNQGRGRGGGWLAHERLGYNYRLSDINCALGIVQLSRINEIVAKRRRVADMYLKRLGGDKRLTVPREPADSIMSWFVYVIRLADRYSLSQRNDILSRMLQRGVQVSNYFPPVYLQPFMAKELGHKEGDLPITDAVCRSTIALPFHNNLTEDEVDFVCEQLAACLAETD